MKTLTIQKSNLIKSGKINYSVDKSGLVEWDASVKINLGVTATEKNFSGGYSLAPDRVRGEYYRKARKFKEGGASVEVTPAEKYYSTLNVEKDGVHVTAKICTRYTLVEIAEVETEFKYQNIKIKVRAAE